MRAIIKLFGRSPFIPLGNHMERVAECVRLLPDLFRAIHNEDHQQMEEIAAQISKVEHKADLSKNDIRRGLKSHLFLPVSRANILDILSIQDTLADKAEDIAVLTTFRSLRLPTNIEVKFGDFLDKNIECFEGIHSVMAEFNELLESSFGGAEAEKIRAAIDQIAYTEHQVDLIQRELLRILFESENELSYALFYLWHRIIQEIGELSNLSEKLGNRVLMTIDQK